MLRHTQRLALVLSLLPWAATLRAGEAETFAIDPVHTRIVFAIGHAGFSKAIGTISGSTGTLRFDRDDWRDASLDVTVPLARLDLGDAKWNAAALASNLLDGKRHPQARFVSNHVEQLDADRATVCGDLSLRGVTRPLCLDVTLNAFKRHPLPPFRRTAGFTATGTLSRRAFGIDAWPSVIGDNVDLRIEAEAVRSRSVPAGDESPSAPADSGPPPAANPIRPTLPL